MKKIYKLKEWYSLQDAADRLTLTFSEEVTVNEVLELALDGHIQLFWYLRHVSAVEVQFGPQELALLTNKKGEILKGNETPEMVIFHDYWEVNPNGRVSYLKGPHSLNLKETGALSDFLRSFLTNTGGELYTIDGFNVTSPDGKIWRILERFDKPHLSDKAKWNEKVFGPYHFDNANNFFPSSKWPEISELGFTKNELEKFENTIQSKEAVELKTRERQTLLKMIIAMAQDAYGYDPTASRSPFPKELEGIMDQLDISVSDDTIRKWLKEAAELLPRDTD